MALPSHKGPAFALSAFSWHSLLALVGFTASRWAHDKAEFLQPEVAGPLVIVSILLGTLATVSTFISCLAPTKTSDDLEDEPDDAVRYFDSTLSCSRFFLNPADTFHSPLVYAVGDGLAVGAMLFYQMFSTHIVAVSICTAGIGLMGLLTAWLIHQRCGQLVAAQEEYKPLNPPSPTFYSGL